MNRISAVTVNNFRIVVLMFNLLKVRMKLLSFLIGSFSPPCQVLMIPSDLFGIF